MPQVDLARGGSGGDGRVTCETLFHSSSDDEAPPPPDQPVPSFYLSKEQEFDWVDRNAYYERKESHKGSTPNPNQKLHSKRFSSSARTKPSTLIGLPTPQTSNFHDPKNRRTGKAGTARFFPKRLGSAGKFSLRLTEPSSPTVSCMGKVRSNRCKWKPGNNNVSKPKKTGFWSSFKQIFKFGSQKKHAVEVDRAPEKSTRSRKDRMEKSVIGEKREEEPVNPPGLGGMNRFVSGRRSDSWAGDALRTENTSKIV